MLLHDKGVGSIMMYDLGNASGNTHAQKRLSPVIEACRGLTLFDTTTVVGQKPSSPVVVVGFKRILFISSCSNRPVSAFWRERLKGRDIAACEPTCSDSQLPSSPAGGERQGPC